jgi:hypothetical protein
VAESKKKSIKGEHIMVKKGMSRVFCRKSKKPGRCKKESLGHLFKDGIELTS